MFNIAMCRFFVEGTTNQLAQKDYEYRIPEYLGDAVKPGMLAVVNWRNGTVNPHTVKVVEVKSALDGEFEGTYSYVLGVVDPAPYEAVLESERRRKRLLTLIKAEKEKLVEGLDFDKLAALSPAAAELIAELKKLS